MTSSSLTPSLRRVTSSSLTRVSSFSWTDQGIVFDVKHLNELGIVFDVKHLSELVTTHY